MANGLCPKCGNKKPYKYSYCQRCSTKWLRIWRRNNKNYRLLSKEEKKRHIARAYTQSYIKTGKLTPQPCRECGNPITQPHHIDYNKPLEIVWLCRQHHIEHHRKEREAKASKCRRCGRIKPLRTRCKVCRKKWFTKWRPTYTPKPPSHTQREKIRIRAATRYAIRSGKLVRQPCETCGNPFSEPDHGGRYDDPFAVRWFCRKHHLQNHNGAWKRIS